MDLKSGVPGWSGRTRVMAPAAPAVPDTSPTVSTRLQPVLSRTVAVSQKGAQLLGILLTPAALMALVVGMWRLGEDLNWTEDFPISTGLFSHWQVWMALAAGLKATGSLVKSTTKRQSS